MIEKIGILSFVICFLCVFLIFVSSVDIIKIDLILSANRILVYQANSNMTYFRIVNEYDDVLYSIKPKYSGPIGINVSFNPTEVSELYPIDKVKFFATIYADENIAEGYYDVRFWVESLDDEGNRVKSATYLVNVSVLRNLTLPQATVSTTTIRVTTSATSSVFTTLEATTTSRLFPGSDETTPNNGWKLSKTQIVLILIILMTIFLIIIPVLSFRERFRKMKKVTEQENHSKK